MMQKDYQDMDKEELLIEYKKTRTLEIKQELTLRYVGVVKKIAIQMRDVYLSFTQVDDIINEGVIAIMSGIDKFDPEMNVKFETFITKRIRGLIIDLARKNDWVPRGVRKAAKDIEQATLLLTEQLGRHPNNQEIADYFGVPLDRYLEDLGKTNAAGMLSLDGVLAETPDFINLKPVATQVNLEPPEANLIRMETREVLMKAIESLRENEKLVLSLYYQNELNMRDIAHVMQVSEPRVSQIHANAVRKLKLYMEKYIND